MHLSAVHKTGQAILRTSDLDDVIQEVFLSAWKGLSGFRGDSLFRTWILGIARNHCFALRKKNKSLDLIGEELSEEHELGLWDRNARDPNLPIELDQILSILPPDQRKLMEMNREGLSDKEIAAAMSLSLRAVRGRMQRGRVLMRERFCRVPEQKDSGGSLMSEQANLQDGRTMSMATPGKRKSVRLKAKQATPAGPARSPEDDASAPFSFDEFASEVQQLEYLAAIEARTRFDAEINAAAETRMRSMIRELLTQRGIEISQEKAVVDRLLEVIGANTVVRADLERLQGIRMGAHSRKARLWYFESVVQCLLPSAIDSVMAATSTVETAILASGEEHEK